jgi:molybdopterin/thiamine biosynthesis adenylyltransferase
MNRYHRQTLLPQIGPEGQARLAAARVLIVGCGALGSVLADQLVRAGVGHVRLVDRDVVELTNLQRQVLFDEADARDGTPKAIAAARRLAAVNSSVVIEPAVADVHAGNVEELAGVGDSGGAWKADLILDGTDNVETRYLINDVSVKHAIPWVYGACVGTEGRVMFIRPGSSPCLQCIFPEPPGPGELPTCDTAGVLGAASAVVASFQAIAAIRFLVSPSDDREDALLSLDVWKGRFRRTSLDDARRVDCPTCGLHEYVYLNRAAGDQTVSLCGRDAIQIRPATVSFDFDSVADRLKRGGSVAATPFLLRFRAHEPVEWNLTLFRDGRAIIHGSRDPVQARSIYAKWVGS